MGKSNERDENMSKGIDTKGSNVPSFEKAKILPVQDDAIRLKLYHGSEEVREIDDIRFPGPYSKYDFGPGFYLAESRRSAEEWTLGKTGHIVNEYDFCAPKSDILYLTGEAWIRVVVGFRLRKYRVFFKSPVICGFIANDRMDISLPFFMRGEIGDQRLLQCLDYCKLGNQYLLRQGTECLSNHSYKVLKGIELQRAVERKGARRREMEEGLLKIRRQPIAGEKYIEDYLNKGDYHEV